jgi:hypothetical protein
MNSAPRSRTTRLRISGVRAQGRRSDPAAFISVIGGLFPMAPRERTSLSSLGHSSHLRPGVVKTEEPVGVQALLVELVVEGLDEGIVRVLASRLKSSTTPFW